MSSPKKTERRPTLPSDARAVASDVVGAWLSRPDRTTSVIQRAERAAADAGLDRRDQALACEIVMGVVRHRLTLTKVLGAFTSQGWAKVRHDLQPVLLVGACQILWLESIPDFAAVDVAVSYAKKRAGTGGGRFVNAVLRNLIRAIQTYRTPLTGTDPRRTVPIRHDQGCVLDHDVFPDPQHDLANWLAETTSHPGALVARWLHTWGHEQTRQICMAGLNRPPLFLRPNALKTTATDLQKRLEAEGVEASVTRDAMVVLTDAVHLPDLPSFQQGWFQPQDPTAARVVREMNLKPGQVVLDLCAGIGTKSTQIAEAMRDQGIVYAADKDPGKLEALHANAHRLGLNCIKYRKLEGPESARLALKQLDWILLDVPCSNTGVLGRRPEARYRVNEKALRNLTALQRDLCEFAFRLAGPSTRIAYSTCSIEPEENATLTQHLGQDHPHWRLQRSELTLPRAAEHPQDSHDGGYWAIWTRI